MEVRPGGFCSPERLNVLHRYVEVPQGVIEACLQVRAGFALTDDQGAADIVFAGGEFFQVAAGDDDAASGDSAFVFYGSGAADVDDLGALGQDYVGAEDGFFFHYDTFHHDAAATEEDAVFDDNGRCLQGFQYAADAYAAAKVDTFADLGAAADGSPGVYHGSFVYIGADVDVAGHEYDVLCEEGAIAGHGVRYGADSQGFIVFLQEHFVIEFEWGEVPGLHLLDAEVEEDGLFDPFVYGPGLGGGLISGAGRGYAEAAFVHFFDDGAYGVGVF